MRHLVGMIAEGVAQVSEGVLQVRGSVGAVPSADARTGVRRHRLKPVHPLAQHRVGLGANLRRKALRVGVASFVHAATHRDVEDLRDGRNRFVQALE